MKNPWMILAILLGIYLLICGLMYAFQEKVMFLPEKLPSNFTFNFRFPHEEVWLDRPDGARLHALYFPADSAKGLVVYFHGNAGSLSRWGTIANDMVPRQHSLLIMDFRSYGKSTGELSQKAILEDALAMYDYAKTQYSEQSITIFGRSLGTGMASYVASQRPVKRLILETPYASISKLAKGSYAWLPVDLLIRYPMPSEKFIEESTCPLWLVHGTDDRLIPVKHSQYLTETFADRNPDYLEIPSGQHNNLGMFPSYQQWLDRALGLD